MNGDKRKKKARRATEGLGGPGRLFDEVSHLQVRRRMSQGRQTADDLKQTLNLRY